MDPEVSGFATRKDLIRRFRKGCLAVECIQHRWIARIVCNKPIVFDMWFSISVSKCGSDLIVYVYLVSAG